MSRQFFRQIAHRFAPLTAQITANPWLRKYLPALADPDLWHLNRHSTARAVAIGLVCGLIPGPLQALAAALACLAFRGHFPLAVLTTFYTNPLTIVPLYVVAYRLGRWFVPPTRQMPMTLPPDLTFDAAGANLFLHWLASMGPSLAIGLALLAVVLGIVGYFGIQLLWRCLAVRAWRRRAQLRARA